MIFGKDLKKVRELCGYLGRAIKAEGTRTPSPCLAYKRDREEA